MTKSKDQETLNKTLNSMMAILNENLNEKTHQSSDKENVAPPEKADENSVRQGLTNFIQLIAEDKKQRMEKKQEMTEGLSYIKTQITTRVESIRENKNSLRSDPGNMELKTENQRLTDEVRDLKEMQTKAAAWLGVQKTMEIKLQQFINDFSTEMDLLADKASYGAAKTAEGTVYGATKIAQGAVYGAEGAVYGAKKTAEGAVYGAKKTAEGAVYGATKTAEGAVYGAKKTAEGAVYGATKIAQGAVYAGSGMAYGITKFGEGVTFGSKEIYKAGVALLNACNYMVGHVTGAHTRALLKDLSEQLKEVRQENQELKKSVEELRATFTNAADDVRKKVKVVNAFKASNQENKKEEVVENKRSPAPGQSSE